ncbi:hypothetical protein BT63DRAFT_418379 [Microthyrium microscopicum]|uniref:Uncharacterized protein n=1 Tax=Microthyrium microscopicum TaxID=703497 RepID=A0A6A6U008_9PEZI|nr:hypothetical protein BT63DRAFT_418379 [Microthyrium microscopicum]
MFPNLPFRPALQSNTASNSQRDQQGNPLMDQIAQNTEQLNSIQEDIKHMGKIMETNSKLMEVNFLKIHARFDGQGRSIKLLQHCLNNLWGVINDLDVFWNGLDETMNDIKEKLYGSESSSLPDA